MQGKIINEIYHNLIESSELPRKYYLLFERVNDNAQQLRKTMNKKNKKRLQSICDDYEHITAIEVDNAFADGFSFAVQLMSEVYSRKI